MADRISNYRQVRLVININPDGLSGSLFTRSVVAGKQADRMVARAIKMSPRSIEHPADMIDALSEALDSMRNLEFTPPR